MKISSLLTLSLTTAALASACSGGSSPTSAASSADATSAPPSQTSAPASKPAATQPPKPAATESNPPGDIPDNQAFVTFRAPGFSVKVPEGWARSGTAATTSFTDKLNRIEITPSAASAAPTVQSVKTQVVSELSR